MIEELLVEDGGKVVAGQELFKLRLTEGGWVWHTLLLCSSCTPLPNVMSASSVPFTKFLYLTSLVIIVDKWIG